MRLEFTILWFENQFRELESQVDELARHIAENGFVPKFESRSDSAGVDELGRRQENFHEFDLVVVDWDLDGEEKGDVVAQRIRAHFPFTPIVFYSGKRPNDLRDMVREKAIDGVYCVFRLNVVQRLKELIDDIVAGLSRLDAMRGLAVSTVSRCDQELRCLVSHIHATSDTQQQKMILQELDGLVEDSSARGKQKYNECKDFEDRLNTLSVTSFHLWKLALSVTKGNGAVANMRSILKRYSDEVIQIRNTLGHATELRMDSSWKIKLLGDNEMRREDFPRLRREFATHLANIVELRSALVADGGE